MSTYGFQNRDGMNYGLWRLRKPRTPEELRQIVRSILVPPAQFHENIGMFWDKTVNSFGQMHPEMSECFVLTPRVENNKPVGRFDDENATHISMCVANVQWLTFTFRQFEAAVRNAHSMRMAYDNYVLRLMQAEGQLA